MLSGNRGEWSEIYVLLKLIADQKVFLGDENLNRISSAAYKILSIIRHEKNHETIYSLSTIVTVKSNGLIKGTFTIEEFRNWAERLLMELIKHKEGAFTFPPIENFLNELNCFNVKAGSDKKKDITLEIFDHQTHLSPALGFSIKSQLGSASTLINATSHTNFTYVIRGHLFNTAEISLINETYEFKEKLNIIERRGGLLELVKIDSPTFLNNLIMVDSYFPEIASEIVLSHYKGIARKLSDIGNYLHSTNPLNYDLSLGHNFYHNKIKRFLSDYALGMMASRVWNGIYEANGGYLIVKKDGDVICYHFYYKNLFEEYLLNNTKTETPDMKRMTAKLSSLDKKPTGVFFQENGEQFIKLNLQVRFLV